MARVSKLDACLICGETPCACKRGKQAAPPVPIASPEITAPIKLEIPQMRPAARVKTRVRPAHMLVADEDLVLIAALRNLESIMSDEAREQFHSELMAPVTPEERSAFWRARHAYEVDAAASTRHNR